MRVAIDSIYARHYEAIKARVRTDGQRTAEWYKRRLLTIGGSEMAILEGHSHFSDLHDLYCTKILQPVNQPTVPMIWGTYFEPITSQLVETWFHTKNSEFGSLEGPVAYSSYSPDGVVVMRLPVPMGMTLDQSQYNAIKKEYRIPVPGHPLPYKKNSVQYEMLDETHMMLLEFKAPYSGIPGMAIPKQYLPQIHAGLASCPEVDAALFINAQYKICARDTLMDPEVSCYARGLLIFSCASGEDTTFTSFDKVRVLDDVIKDVFLALHSGTLAIHYIDPIMHRDDICHIEDLYDDVKFDILRADRAVYGIMPWKLEMVDCIVQPRTRPDYLTMLAPKIKEVVENIIRINAMPDNEKMAEIVRIAPSTKNKVSDAFLKMYEEHSIF
jgi:hypothetical protein